MTILEAVQQIYLDYEGDTDYPEFDDDDMQLYFAHIKTSLKKWSEKFPNSREGFKELDDASTGDKVTEAGVKTIDAPTNFIRPANYIFVGDKKLEYLPPQKMDLFPTDEWFSITGRPGAYKIIINPIPGAVLPVKYSFYGTLEVPTGASSVIDISRPNYCISYVLHKLYLDDPNNKDLAAMYKQEMMNEVRAEKIELFRTPTGTPNRISGRNYQRNSAGFGILASQQEGL